MRVQSVRLRSQRNPRRKLRLEGHPGRPFPRLALVRAGLVARQLRQGLIRRKDSREKCGSSPERFR